MINSIDIIRHIKSLCFANGGCVCRMCVICVTYDSCNFITRMFFSEAYSLYVCFVTVFLLRSWCCWFTIQFACVSMRCVIDLINYYLEIDRISPSVFVLARNVDTVAISANIWFWPKAVVQHSVHHRFRRAAVGKFSGCRK